MDDTSAGAARAPRSRLRWWLAWAAVVAVVLGSIGAFRAASEREQTFEDRRADAFADRAASAVAAVLQSSLATLAGARALSAPGGQIDRTAFAGFAKEVIARSSIDALAVSDVVPAAQRSAFEQETGRPINDRGADGGFVAAAPRDLYFPVAYAVPDDATRQALIGFDIGADPQRQAAVATATATGAPQVAAVRLAPSNRPGLFVVYPIEADGHVVALISGAFLGANLAPLIANLLPSGASFELRTTDGAVLASAGAGPFESTASASLAGTDFTVVADDGVGAATAVPRGVLGGGLALAVFLTIFFAQASRHERQLSIAVDKAEASERREQETTLALQARLLPASLPEVRGLDISARYLAAAEGTRVGGDWYDVINLSKHRVLLTVGDVVGQGPASAALMGQLRTLMHEAALRESDPAATVGSLDAIAARTSEAFGSTCVAVELDAETGALRYCRAGHPWPLVVGAAGERWLEVSGGAPLGVSRERPEPATDHLAQGEALVLFTDGAVERRGEDVDEGMAEVAAAARSAAGQGADAICDAILERVSSPGGDDLVLLVAARAGT